MPIPEDERNEKFENYLRRFRPVEAAELSLPQSRPVWRRWFVVPVAVGAVAAVLLILFVTLRRPTPPPTSGGIEHQAVDAQVSAQPQPLTISSARALLAQSPSVKTALDGMAFTKQSPALRPGEQSALNILGKEKTKL